MRTLGLLQLLLVRTLGLLQLRMTLLPKASTPCLRCWRPRTAGTGIRIMVTLKSSTGRLVFRSWTRPRITSTEGTSCAS